jgi:hypothetical protein
MQRFPMPITVWPIHKYTFFLRWSNIPDRLREIFAAEGDSEQNDQLRRKPLAQEAPVQYSVRNFW